VAVREVCGNDYDKAIRGEPHTFDGFACAIRAPAPTRRHCGVRIVGHGVELGGAMFCRAQAEGATRLRDRA
jgi:hypothetical protein